jgi:uncharacterized protein (TIGR02466 family)
MTKRSIFPLFSAPLYVNNVGAFDAPDIRTLEYTNRLPDGSYFNFLTSTDKSVLDRPSFAAARVAVMTEIEWYVRELCHVSRAVEFYVTNSWVNVYRPGDQAGAHTHHNSLLSGVLYLRVKEGGGDIVFHRDVNSLVPFPPALDLDMDAANLYNCKSWAHTPQTNDICLFPSVVSHSVEPNRSDEERWSLAFNVFVRGRFGALHTLDIR